jgi:hypothetical protein
LGATRTRGRLKAEAVSGSIRDGKNGNVTYGYDNVGNRLSRTSSLAGIANQSFGYEEEQKRSVLESRHLRVGDVTVGAIDGIEHDIGNGTLKPYKNKDVYVL